MTTTTLEHTLHIPDASGDLRINWDVDDEKSVMVARQAFADALAQGMTPHVVDDTTGAPTGEVIREFDPQATAIVFRRQSQGG